MDQRIEQLGGHQYLANQDRRASLPATRSVQTQTEERERRISIAEMIERVEGIQSDLPQNAYEEYLKELEKITLLAKENSENEESKRHGPTTAYNKPLEDLFPIPEFMVEQFKKVPITNLCQNNSFEYLYYFGPHENTTNNYSYIGQYLHSHRHGYGIMTWQSGGLYRGHLVAGKKAGYGLNIFTDAYIYYGQWQDSNRHGKGVLRAPNGAIYDGDWLFDYKEGKGRYLYSDGCVYEGQWKENNRHGVGTLTFPDGACYQGE